MPNQDYFPNRHTDRLTWWNNISAKVADFLQALGLSAADKTQLTTWGTDEATEINAIEQARIDYEEAVATYRTNNRARMAPARALIARAKTAPATPKPLARTLAG